MTAAIVDVPATVNHRRSSMLRRMDAEILFHNPDDVNPGIAELTRLGFDVEILDTIDPFGPTVWVKAQTITDLDESSFFDWVQSVVEPLEGWLYEAGASGPPPLFA